MTVNIVTDSTADIPAQLIKEFGITVVPLYVRFGNTVYRDRVEMSEDDFYSRLQRDSIHPTTTQPTPQDFAEIYRKLSSKADGIISIHISEKLSGTCNSAAQGKKMVENGCPVEIINSKSTSMALGLIVLAAAALAAEGKSLQQIAGEVRRITNSIQLFAIFDTLKYLAKGGRIGKAKSLLGSMLSVKPMLTIKDGEFLPVSQFRSRTKGIEKLFDYARDADNMEDMAIIHSTTPDEAQALADRINSTLHPKNKVIIARLGPALGVHGGPGVLGITFRKKCAQS